jgi:Amt family ammonium transporter
MQTGFAMLTAGSVRSKNVKNILLWNLLDSCGGALAFWSVGYAFAYGGTHTFIGNTNFFLIDTDFETWFFQFAFACALSSIVAGTVAERCQMKAYLFYSVFLVGFCYPVVARAFWSEYGFLSPSNANPLWGTGVIDLAGSGPVHMTGGATALVAAITLGPRRGRFHDEDGNVLVKQREFGPHSVALQFLGTFCLWFGWYGFNPGSVLKISSASSGFVASLAAVNTTLGAAAAAVSAMFSLSFVEYYKTGLTTYDLTATMNGCLTGLVAITAGCATVEPWAAVVIGIVAGWVYLFSSWALIKLRIDDAVDAIPVHFAGGWWGVWATGLFSSPRLMEAAFSNSTNVGWFYEWGRGSANFTLMGLQIVGTLFVIGWTCTVMGIYFWVLNYFNVLRIDELEEEVGMDISFHKGSAYAIEEVRADKVIELDESRSGRSFRHDSRPKQVCDDLSGQDV